MTCTSSAMNKKKGSIMTTWQFQLRQINSQCEFEYVRNLYPGCPSEFFLEMYKEETSLSSNCFFLPQTHKYLSHKPIPTSSRDRTTRRTGSTTL